MSGKISKAKHDEEETMTVWQEIIKTGDVQAVRDHIAAGADINEKDEFGCSLLQEAALQKNPALVQLFLDMGLDVNARDNHGGTALIPALSIMSEY